MARAAVGDQLERVEFREEDVRRVVLRRLVGTREVLEQGEEGVEHEGNSRGADLDEGSARAGDDVVEREVLGGRAGAVGELPRRRRVSLRCIQGREREMPTRVVSLSTRAPTRTLTSPFMARRDWLEAPPFMFIVRLRLRSRERERGRQQRTGAFS